MPAISSPTTIRRKGQMVTNLYLNIPPLVELATATVASTPVYPTATIAVTSVSANWLNVSSQLLVRIFKPSGALAYEGAVRKNVTATELYIPRLQPGDSGNAQELYLPIESGDTVRVYDVFVVMSLLSRVDGVDFYKREDVLWDNGVTSTSRLTEFPAPVINLGVHRHFRVAPGGTVQFTMSAATSFNWLGNANSYTWFLPAGVSFVAPSVNTDTTVTLQASPGIYRIRCRGTDATTGRVDNNYRLVFVTDGSTVKAFSDDFAVTAIESDTQTRLGRAMTITVKASRGVNVFSRLYPRAAVLLTYEHLYSADDWATSSSAPDGVVGNFFGYIRSYERIGTDSDGVDTYTIRVESPLQFFAALPVPVQSIIAKVAPAAWNEVVPTLANVAYFAYYLLQYHAAGLMSFSDFLRGDLTAFTRPAFSSTGSDIVSAVKRVLELAQSNIGCTSDGAIVLRRNPNYESTAYRASVPTVWTWQADDILGELTYTRDPLMAVAEVEGAATIATTSGTPTVVRARSAIFAARNAVQVQTLTDFIGLSSDDIRDRVGHAHAALNAPTPSIRFEAPTGHDFTEPALMEWHSMSLAAYDPTATGIMSTRVLPTDVSRQWTFDERGVSKQVTVSVAPETRGGRAPIKPAASIGQTLNPSAPVGGWCYLENFTLSDGGYAARQTNTAVYVAGQGWGQAQSPITADTIFFVKSLTIASGSSITRLTITFNKNTSGAAPYVYWLGAFPTPNYYVRQSAATPSSVFVLNYTLAGTGSPITIGAGFDPFEAGLSADRTFQIVSIKWEGTGVNPFGVSNC